MYIIKKIIIFIFTISLTGCISNINISPLLPTSDYLLVATSFDTTVDAARSKALNLLAQNIFVQVKSSFYSKESLNNNGIFTSNAINQINLDSAAYFQDIVYSNPEKISKNQYKISVGLTSTSLINSINYLNADLKISLIDNLSKTELKEELDKTNFLISLIIYANSKSIKLKNIDITTLTKYKNNLALRMSDVSRITFNILPNLNNISKININNKDYNATETIFLPNGIYFYTVYAKGYKTITNKIDIPSNDKLFVNIYLQKILTSPIKVKLDIISDSIKLNSLTLKSQISTLIEKFQLKESNFTTNILRIHFLPSSYNIINDYYYFTLPVDISLIKNNTQNLSKTFTITYVSSNINSNISANSLIKKIEEFLEELTADNNLNNIYK